MKDKFSNGKPFAADTDRIFSPFSGRSCVKGLGGLVGGCFIKVTKCQQELIDIFLVVAEQTGR